MRGICEAVHGGPLKLQNPQPSSHQTDPARESVAMTLQTPENQDMSHHRIAAAATALLIATGLTACGSSSTPSLSTPTPETPTPETPTPGAIEGVVMPSSISVVTATNLS